MSGNSIQTRQTPHQVLQQLDQGENLLIRIGFVHLLVAGMEPVGIATPIDQFYADATSIETSYMVSNTGDGNPLFQKAITVNIKMTAIAGLGLWVHDFLTPLTCLSQVRQFGAVNYHQVDGMGIALFKPLCVGQRVLNDFYTQVTIALQNGPGESKRHYELTLL